MIKPRKLPKDANQRAQHIAKLLTGELIEGPEPERSVVSAYLAEIGRKGGLKGGKARAETLSNRKRRAIARTAAEARWHPTRPKPHKT
jgi:hypothetical protein